MNTFCKSRGIRTNCRKSNQLKKIYYSICVAECYFLRMEMKLLQSQIGPLCERYLWPFFQLTHSEDEQNRSLYRSIYLNLVYNSTYIV